MVLSPKLELGTEDFLNKSVSHLIVLVLPDVMQIYAKHPSALEELKSKKRPHFPG